VWPLGVGYERGRWRGTDQEVRSGGTEDQRILMTCEQKSPTWGNLSKRSLRTSGDVEAGIRSRVGHGDAKVTDQVPWEAGLPLEVRLRREL
jgi:hypothetical protein